MAFQALNTLTIHCVRLALLLSHDNFVTSVCTVQCLYVELKFSNSQGPPSTSSTLESITR